MMLFSTFNKRLPLFLGCVLFVCQLLAQPTLVCLNSEGTPAHTATFDYQSGTNALGKIIFGDGEERVLTTASGRITHVYQYSGVYHAVFMLNNLPTDTATVIVQTPCGFAAFVNELNAAPSAVPRFCENIAFGVFHVEPIRIAQTYYWTTLHNIRRLGVNGDAATFEMRAKNPIAGGGISCNDLSASLMGSKGTAHVSFTTTGCGFYTSASAGRTARAQISELAVDVEDWHVFKLQTDNHVLSIFYDNTLVFSMPYAGEIGEVAGISINFKGSGWVDAIELKENGATTTALKETFTDCQTAQTFVTSNDTLTICGGQTVFFNNQTLTQSGTYRDTIAASNCVDTIRVLRLTVLSLVKFVQNLTIREGDSLVLNGVIRRTTGIFLDTLRRSSGCDSIVETRLTVLPCNLSVQILRNGDVLRAWVQNAPPQYQVTFTRPDGTTTANTVVITLSGIYTVRVKDVLGCEATAQINAQREGYAVGGSILGCSDRTVWLPVLLKKEETDLAGLITTFKYDTTQFRPTGRTKLTRVSSNCLVSNSINGNQANFLLYLNRLLPIAGLVGDTLFLVEFAPVTNFLRDNAIARVEWGVEEDHFRSLSESYTGTTSLRVEGTTAAAFSVLFNNTTELRRDNNKPFVVFGTNCTTMTDTFFLDNARRGIKRSPYDKYQIQQKVCDTLDRRIETSDDVYWASQIALSSRSFIPTCYQMWAADCDGTGKISAIDISILQQRLLGYMPNGFLMPDGSHKTRLYFPKKLLTQRNWHVSTRYPDADTEGGMTRQNVPLLNNCFSLDDLRRCDTLAETIVEVKIGDVDGTSTTILRTSGTLLADYCARKEVGDTAFIPVVSPQSVRSLDFFVADKTPFLSVEEVENGRLKVKARTSHQLNISGYVSGEGVPILPNQTLFYLVMPIVKGASKMPDFTTDKVLINGQLATFKLTDATCQTPSKQTTGLEVFPNPTTDLVELRYTKGIESQIVLMDVIGKPIKTWQTNGSGQVVLDLSDLSAGLYVLTWNGQAQKIVKH